MGSTRSSHTPPTAPPPMHNLAHDEHIPSGGTFVRTDEPTLIHHYHPNTAVSTGFILGFVPFMGLDKYIVTCIHHYCIIQSRFTAPSIHLFIPPLHFNPWQPLILNCLQSFAISRLPYSWNHTVCSLFRLATFT